MPAFSINPKRRRDNTRSKFKVMGNHDEFLSRIKKTLYYGKLPMTERFSLPVSELASELFSEVKNGHSLDYLHLDEAATLSRNACVSPCSLVLALLYLERLKTCNPEYLRTVASSELFLVSMMVASKFLNDDGEEDEVFNDEWAASAGISVKDINQIEREFLQAIDWEVFVSEQAFWKQLCKVETNVALQEGKRRGWFSYTDLDQLLETVDLAALAQVVVVVSAVCLTSYTASVLTLLGSVFAVSHMPGTSLSPRLPLQPVTTQCSSSFASLDELTSKDCATQTVTPVDVLTTSFILASIGSSNHNQSEAVDSSHRRSENYVNVCDVDKVENVLLQSNFYSWTVSFSNFAFSYLGFQEFHPYMITSIPSYFTLFNENCTKELFTDVYEGEKEDKINHNSRFDVEFDDATPDGILGEWTYIFQNWFEQESFGKNLQIQFFPLEITTY